MMVFEESLKFLRCWIIVNLECTWGEISSCSSVKGLYLVFRQILEIYCFSTTGNVVFQSYYGNVVRDFFKNVSAIYHY